MKKAIIDQILLGLFIFVTLIVIGATINDTMEAKDKYYKLKVLTDNAALTLAKYYVNVEQNSIAAEDIYNDMLTKTNVGNEIKDSIIYTWNTTTEPNYVIASIPSYDQETFWFKFLDLGSFNLSAESKAVIITQNSPDTPTSNVSYGIAPFAINYSDDLQTQFENGTALNFSYDVVSNWDYNNKSTFYPIVPTSLINCDCPYILSSSFDWSGLGFDTSLCNAANPECDTDGESEFRSYTQAIDDIYNAKLGINFDTEDVSSIVSLLGTYLGDNTSTWATQMNHLSDGLYDLVNNDEDNLPIQLDIITLNSSGVPSGVVRVQVNGFDFDTTGKPTTQYITLQSTIVGKEIKIVKLEY